MELEQLKPEARVALTFAWSAWVRRVGGPQAEEQGGKQFTAGWLAALDYVAEQLAPHGITL